MAWGFERPPRWAVVALIVGAVAFVALAALVSAQARNSRPSQSAIDAAEAEAEASRSAQQAAAAAVRRVLVIGDSYTAGTEEGGLEGANWTALVGQQLEAAGLPARLIVSAQPGAGYVKTGAHDATFASLARDAADRGPYDLVVIFGSRNDAGLAGVQDAAAGVLGDVRASSPDAPLLVIGPPWVNDDPPTSIIEARDEVRDAATAAGASFVDPLAEGWFAGQVAGLIGSDGVHPTDQGHAHLAELIGSKLRAALEALPPPG